MTAGSGPRVRVVVVNYNGGGDTLACLDSVLASDWPADDLEVVLVDNASVDGVAATVKAGVPRVSVIESGRNRGFAGGCNLALQDLSTVDYVALLNNDATVDPGWLGPLVRALEGDVGLGAASPRILFRGTFVDVAISAPTEVRGRGDSRQLGVQLSGVRLGGVPTSLGRLQLVDGFWGPEHDADGAAGFQWTSGRALLRVPVAEDGALPACELRLSADSDRLVTLTSGPNTAEHLVTAAPAWFTVPLGGTPSSVVNNVGSVLVADGYGADRGYQELDGERFDQPAEVFAWCGAAVVLSREYLASVGLFDEDYFLYYEDFDLSWRGRSQGWRYVYVPDSVVHHVHSASSVEGSRLFAHFVERNRLLTLTRNAPLGFTARAGLRYLLITGSYVRRDIVSPMAHGRRPSPETVVRRLRALGGFGRLLPHALAGRRQLHRRQTIGDAELLGWLTEA